MNDPAGIAPARLRRRSTAEEFAYDDEEARQTGRASDSRSAAVAGDHPADRTGDKLGGPTHFLRRRKGGASDVEELMVLSDQESGRSATSDTSSPSTSLRLRLGALGSSSDSENDESINTERLSPRYPLALSPNTARLEREEQVRQTNIANKVYDEEGKKRLNQYTLLEKIGVGSFGKVKLAYNRDNGQNYAVKIIRRSLLKRKRIGRMVPSIASKLEMEIAIMKKLQHENIVSLYEVIDDPELDRFYLIMDYCEKGDIMTLSADRAVKPLPIEQCWEVFRQQVQGLNYLHESGVLHRDLKPENMLMDGNGICKLADFGVSHIFQGNDEGGTHLNDGVRLSYGTPAFQPPESAGGSEVVSGKAEDVWALGATLYCLVFGQVPFVASTVFDLIDKIQSKPLSFPNPTNADLEDLLHGILCKDPEKRLTLAQIAEHPWVTQGHDRLSVPSYESVTATAEEGAASITCVDRFALLVRMKSRMKGQKAAAQSRIVKRASQEFVVSPVPRDPES